MSNARLKIRHKTAKMKITSAGKYSIMVTSSLKPFLKEVLEHAIAHHANYPRLNLDTCDNKILVALLREMYAQQIAKLMLMDRDSRLTITESQCLALWTICQVYESEAVYANPEMGNFLLNVHQRLS